MSHHHPFDAAEISLDSHPKDLGSVSTSRSEVSSEDDDLRQQQEQESLELARRLMEEEAMASYAHHFGMIREDQLSPEDFAAYQSILREDDSGVGDGDDEYEAMLELGDRIGNVKSERWAMVAEKKISELESFRFKSGEKLVVDETKCLVCQCEYEDGEHLRCLPCSHCFHQECVDPWLLENDTCPYCRKSIEN